MIAKYKLHIIIFTHFKISVQKAFQIYFCIYLLEYFKYYFSNFLYFLEHHSMIHLCFQYSHHDLSFIWANGSLEIKIN
jgi:hypothetical protein